MNIDLNNLSLFTQIYLIIAIVSTTLYILKIILTIIGAEHHSDFHTEHPSDCSNNHNLSDFQLVSFNSILSFFVGFSWIGLFLERISKINLILLIIISILAGFIVMISTALIFSQMKKLEHVTVYDINKCVGLVGKAYTSFQPKQKGQVQLEVFGKLCIYNAINSTNIIINSFSKVIVIDVQDNELIISNYEEEITD